MGAGSWELITTNESPVVTKPILDPNVVENLECDGRFPDPARTDESDRLEVFSESDDRLDYFVSSETGPRRRRRQFTRRNTVQT